VWVCVCVCVGMGMGMGMGMGVGVCRRTMCSYFARYFLVSLPSVPGRSKRPIPLEWWWAHDGGGGQNGGTEGGAAAGDFMGFDRPRRAVLGRNCPAPASAALLSRLPSTGQGRFVRPSNQSHRLKRSKSLQVPWVSFTFCTAIFSSTRSKLDARGFMVAANVPCGFVRRVG
jgi:hypothetical protein